MTTKNKKPRSIDDQLHESEDASKQLSERKSESISQENATQPSDVVSEHQKLQQESSESKQITETIVEKTPKDSSELDEEQKKIKAAEEFKRNAQCELEKHTVGNIDSLGYEITRIYNVGNEFVIYEVKTNQNASLLSVALEPWTEEDKNRTVANFYDVSQKYVQIKGYLYKVVDQESYKSRIANILAMGIQGNVDKANKLLDELILEINQIYRNRCENRLKYLSTVLLFVSILILLALGTYYYDLFLEKPIIRHLIFVITSGSIGGFISVSRRLREMIFEKDVAWYTYFFYGIERLHISVFGAVIIYFAIFSNLAIGIVNEIDNSIYGTLVFAFVAGFSESLIPNLLIKLENENA